MTAKQLTDSILQMAIQGKLVPQDPNDEPASVLLERIREEKRRLVAEGKLKANDIVEKPIEEQDYPYAIPESWEWVRLEDITIYISRGKSPVYSETKKYPVVAQKCNQWSGFSLEKAKFVDPKTVDKYAEERLLQNGDLLWNSTGLGTLGRMAIYDSSANEYGWAVADSHVTVIRTKTDFCFFKFLYYYFASPEVQRVIEDKSDGSTKQKELAQETVRKYEVPLPPLAEQHRIVERIEEYLPVIKEYGEAYDEASKMDAELPDRLKKSILQEAIMGKLGTQDPNDEPAKVVIEKIRDLKNSLAKKGIIKKKDLTVIPIEEDEIPFNIPDTWEWVRLNELLTIISDGTHKTPNYVPSGIPFLSVQNISSGKLSLDKIKDITEEEHRQLIKRVEPHKGDILLCRIGTLGKAIKIYWDFEFSIFVSLGLLRPVMEAIADYIVFCINSPLGTRWILENRVGGGTHTYKINLSDIPNFIIPLPPLKEQARIFDKIKEIFAEIDNMTSNNIIIKETEETERD